MRTYEHPGTYQTFRASTPAHAAARVHGGKPGDYFVTERRRKSLFVDYPDVTYYEVTRVSTGEFVGDIYPA